MPRGRALDHQPAGTCRRPSGAQRALSLRSACAPSVVSAATLAAGVTQQPGRGRWRPAQVGRGRRVVHAQAGQQRFRRVVGAGQLAAVQTDVGARPAHRSAAASGSGCTSSRISRTGTSAGSGAQRCRRQRRHRRQPSSTAAIRAVTLLGWCSSAWAAADTSCSPAAIKPFFFNGSSLHGHLLCPTARSRRFPYVTCARVMRGGGSMPQLESAVTKIWREYSQPS